MEQPETIGQMLVRSESQTSPEFGKAPHERTVAELIKCGVVCIDKPMGPTSHQVSAWVKKLLNIERAGHCGTLDPRVTGVLPVALENGTRAADAVLLSRKEYVGIMQLHRDVEPAKVMSVAEDFVGEIYQMPPVRAAVKRQLRTRRIYELSVLEFGGRHVLFRASCESGTYIRTLCVDIGDALGVGGHMADLRRTRTAAFTERDAVPLQELADRYAWWKESGDEKIREIIHPLEKLLQQMPKIIVKDSAVDALCHGAGLAVPGISKADSAIRKGHTVAIMTLKGEGISIGSALMDARDMLQRDEGFAATAGRVLMEPGTYPRVWRKRAQ